MYAGAGKWGRGNSTHKGGKVHGRVEVQCISRVIEGLASRACSPWLPRENAGIASAVFWLVSNEAVGLVDDMKNAKYSQHEGFIEPGGE
jgi:hypothetical protein